MLELFTIPTNKISPNPHNPNVVTEDVLAKLRAEIGQKGLCVPIHVRKRDEGYEIVDGEHRWRICRDLGINEIPCIVHEYDDNEAKIKLLQLNYMRGSTVPIKLASLIHDLNKEISLEDLANRLPYDEPKLKDDLELLKLPEDFGKKVEEEAEKLKEEMPTVMTFVLIKEQAKMLEEAVNIALKDIPDGTKNSKAVALHTICSFYLQNKQLTENNDSPEAIN